MSKYTKHHQLYYYKHKKEIQKRTKEYRRQYAHEYYVKHRERILAEKKARRISKNKEIEQRSESTNQKAA